MGVRTNMYHIDRPPSSLYCCWKFKRAFKGEISYTHPADRGFLRPRRRPLRKDRGPSQLPHCHLSITVCRGCQGYTPMGLPSFVCWPIPVCSTCVYMMMPHMELGTWRKEKEKSLQALFCQFEMRRRWALTWAMPDTAGFPIARPALFMWCRPKMEGLVYRGC